MRTPRVLAAVLLSLLLAIPVLGAVRDEPQSPLAFVRVEVPPSIVDVPHGSRCVAVRLVPSVDDRRPVLQPSCEGVQGAEHASANVHHPDATRPNPVIPSPHLIVVTVESEPRSSVARHNHVVRGSASWYCGHGSPCTRGYPGGLYAAAGPTLRVGQWRGRTVHVVAGGASVDVVLIDCNCGPDANLIDLYSDTFRRLAPLSQGVVSVTVSW